MTRHKRAPFFLLLLFFFCLSLKLDRAEHPKIVLKDGLRSLLLVATSLDDECQYNAAVIYRKLCADRHTHDYVVGRGGLQALLGLVQLRGLGTQRQAAAALRDMCSNKDHKVINRKKVHGLLTSGVCCFW